MSRGFAILMRVTELIDPPPGRLMLVYGPPGAGKSTFLVKLLAHNILDLGRPAVVVLSDREPEAVLEELERTEPAFRSRANSIRLQFIDAFRGTVGIFSDAKKFHTASCADLSSLAITLTKLIKSMDSADLVIIFDSLTPIYLINGVNAIRFVQTSLMRHVAERRRVVVAIDEGCGRSEDIMAISSLAGAVIRLYPEDSQRVLHVIKHPWVAAAKFPVADKETKQLRCRVELTTGTEKYESHYALLKETKIRTQLDDWVDILWAQLVMWGGIAWDPIRFPKLLYELSKDIEAHCLSNSKSLWTEEDHQKIGGYLEKLDIHDAKAALTFMGEGEHSVGQRFWHGQPLEAQSTRSMFRYRKKESALCWGLPKVGSSLCFYDCGALAGILVSMDKEGCEWEVYEEQCVGMGNDSCVMVISPERSPKFLDSFSKLGCDAVAEIGHTVMNEIILRAEGQRKIPTRPRFGDLAFLSLFQEVTSVPALSDERYLMAMRMAGAKVGHEIATLVSKRAHSALEAERFMESIYSTMKAGRMRVGETIRIFENCESVGIKINEPLCFFTTGLLNGFSSAILNRRIKKTKCVATNDRYCEWEFV